MVADLTRGSWLFEAHRRLGEEDLLRFAEEIGLDVRRFGREMAEHAHAGRVRRDLESGLSGRCRRVVS
jgi:hypothetical protein